VRQSVIVSVTLSAFLWNALPAFANDPDGGSNADVMTRARPEYDAPGIRVGSFFLYPALTAGLGYSDNVFNDSSNVGDYFYSIGPELKFQSAWARHALNFSASSKIYSYSNQESEDRTDWNVSADTRIDVVRGTEIKADVHFAREHEPRGTDLTGGLVAGDPAEPTEFSRTGFGAEFGHTLNRVRVSLGGSLDMIDYEDTPRVPVAVPAFFNNDDRDRTITEVFAKAAFEATQDTALFVRGRVNEHDFDTAVDDDGFNRDSNGWGIDGGVEFAMTHVLVGEIFAGYESRSYDDPAFVGTDELAFGAGLKWFPSMLTTITVDGARTIEDTSITAASGYVSTRGRVGIDHELLRNFILSGRLGYENAQYQDVARNDDVLTGSFSGRLLINNNLHFDAGWEFIDRDSNALPFEYSTGQFQFSLTGKL
jgi:hypothetical protein